MTPAPHGPTTIDALFVILDVDPIESSAVRQGQVGEQLIALERAGIRTALLTTCRDQQQFETTIGERIRAAGTRVTLVPQAGRSANLRRMAQAYRAIARDAVVRMAYTRGVWGAVVIRVAAAFNPAPYLYDVRGLIGDETRAGSGSELGLKAAILGGLERSCIRAAARVTAVSAPLADELRKNVGRTDVTVIPSCVDAAASARGDSASIRADLGFGANDVVFVYSGGFSAYQQLERTISLWARLSTDPAIRFLVLTHGNHRPEDPSPFAANESFADQVVQRRVSRDDVPRYLAACDVGFVLRERRLMNRVASPVKFAEYLAAGLAVVGSPETGDMSSLIVEHLIGALVDPANLAPGVESVQTLVANLRRDRAEFRKRSRSLAATRYDWGAYQAVHRELYGVAGEEMA